MIQRIQSVYLFLAALIMLLFLFLPIGAIQVPPPAAAVLVKASDKITSMMPAVATGILLLMTVFLYNNRKLQMRMCRVGLVLSLSVLVGGFTQLGAAEKTVGAIGVEYRPWIALPLVVLVLVFMALLAIRKDDRLVRSADRLR